MENNVLIKTHGILIFQNEIHLLIQYASQIFDYYLHQYFSFLSFYLGEYWCGNNSNWWWLFILERIWLWFQWYVDFAFHLVLAICLCWEMSRVKDIHFCMQPQEVPYCAIEFFSDNLSPSHFDSFLFSQDCTDEISSIIFILSSRYHNCVSRTCQIKASPIYSLCCNKK